MLLHCIQDMSQTRPSPSITHHAVVVLQMLYHVMVFAFLMVMLFTMLMTPILLYIFDLRHAGWKWQHAALFAAMIAPTDAVSVSSILKKGTAPLYRHSEASDNTPM